MQELNHLNIIKEGLESAKSPEERLEWARAYNNYTANELLSKTNRYSQPDFEQLSGDPTIYFSYAWDNNIETEEKSHEKIVNKLHVALNNSGYCTIKDKNDLKYKGLISDFMKRIGKGNLIIIAISEKYLKSHFCMFELYEIYRNSKQETQEFLKRIFPLHIEFIDFKNPNTLDEYLSFWEKKEKEWIALIKKRPEKISTEHFVEYDKVRQISSSFSKLTSFISDINSLSMRLLSRNDFEEVRSAIDIRIKDLRS